MKCVSLCVCERYRCSSRGEGAGCGLLVLGHEGWGRDILSLFFIGVEARGELGSHHLKVVQGGHRPCPQPPGEIS